MAQRTGVRLPAPPQTGVTEKWHLNRRTALEIPGSKKAVSLCEAMANLEGLAKCIKFCITLLLQFDAALLWVA
jgi:hypothetical protein